MVKQVGEDPEKPSSSRCLAQRPISLPFAVSLKVLLPLHSAPFPGIAVPRTGLSGKTLA